MGIGRGRYGGLCRAVLASLEYGEKKRVVIATVLSMNPALLALDEPTSGLDPNARSQLISLLGGLGQFLVAATHDVDLALHVCERTVVLDAGEVVAAGPTDTILKNDALVEMNGLM